MEVYKKLASSILDYGSEQKDRTGKGTYALFGVAFSMDLSEGFPVVTGRKIAYKQAFGELAAFLRGYTKKSEFNSVGCTYWDKFGKDDDLGPIYGKQWVHWRCPPFGAPEQQTFINQIDILAASIKNEPHSRRLMLQTWNPGEINEMVLPPCHTSAQFDVRNGKLSCIVNMRSVDVMLGLPYDIIVYALLTEILAKQSVLQPGYLIFMTGNTHIYLPHVMEAIKYVRSEEMYELPKLVMPQDVNVWNYDPSLIRLDGYEHGPEIKFELFV